MYTQSNYVIERIHKDAYDSAYREAEKLRALRRAGLLKPGRLEQITCRGIACLGRLLVTVGRRMERAEIATNRAYTYSAGA